MSKLSFLKNMDRNKLLVAIAVIGIIITGVLIYANDNENIATKDWTFGLLGKSSKQIGQAAVDYINNKQLSASTVTLKEAIEESGLVKIKIDVGGQEFDSYVTKDGKLLFATPPIVMTSNTEEEKKQAAGEVKKSDSPMLEAYVVSRCPFGLQIQRAMADAVKNMPELGKYMKAVYIGSVSGNTITAMHGAEEAKENLRQICIREEQPEKYWDYVACQMKADGTETSCEKSTGVDSASLSACITDSGRGVAYAKKDFDSAEKYNVSGSPTIILNETTINESNFGGRSSDGVKSMICAGFNSEASFCSTELNKVEAASGFSQTYEGTGESTGGADCN